MRCETDFYHIVNNNKDITVRDCSLFMAELRWTVLGFSSCTIIIECTCPENRDEHELPVHKQKIYFFMYTKLINTFILNSFSGIRNGFRKGNDLLDLIKEMSLKGYKRC